MSILEILILIASIVIVVTTLAFSIYKRVKAKRGGKIYRGCMNSCSSCPYSSSCQTTFANKDKEYSSKNNKNP